MSFLRPGSISGNKGQADTKKLEYLEDKETSKENLEDAALLAAEAQPTGTTFETTTVQTKVELNS